MKKLFIISILFLAGFVAKATAGDIVSPLKGIPESAYNVSHSTVAISSQAATSDAAVNGYRAIYLTNLNPLATIYYTLNGSSTNITTIGWPIYPRPATTVYPATEKIEYNGIIFYRLAPGATGSVDVVKKTILK